LRPTVPGIAELLRRFYTNNLPVSRKAPEGSQLHAQAWIIRNLITIFAKVAKRPHKPRCAGVRSLFEKAGIPVPASSASSVGDDGHESSDEDHSAGESAEGGESEAASDDMEVEAEVTASVPGETEPLETSGSVCGSCHWLDGDGVWRKGSVPDAEQWDVVTGGKLETKKPAEDEKHAGTISKLSLPGVTARSPPSESSSSLVVTPPPKGLPYSPQSEAKKRGKHYFVKDRAYGYRCLNCDCASMDLEVLKAIECQPPKGSEARVHAADEAELELAKLRDLEAEGLQLEELLLHEQRQLEEMMMQAEIEELQKQLAIEEQQLYEAKVRSLEDAAREAAAAAGVHAQQVEPTAARDANEVQAPAARDAKEVEAPARDAKQVEAPAARDAKEVEAPAARDAKEVEAPAARDAKEVEAPAARDAKEVEAPAARDAKRPRTSTVCCESSSTPNPLSSGDPEGLAKNALLGAPCLPSATGPDCLETVPWNFDDAGLEDANVGEPHHLISEEPSEHGEGDKEPVSPKSAKQEDLLPACPDTSKAEPLSPAEQTQLSGARGKANGKARARCPRKAAGDDDDEGGSEPKDAVLKRPAARSRGGRGRGRTPGAKGGGRGRGRGRGCKRPESPPPSDHDDDDADASGAEEEEKEEEEDASQDEAPPCKHNARTKKPAPKEKEEEEEDAPSPKKRGPKRKRAPIEKEQEDEAPSPKKKRASPKSRGSKPPSKPEPKPCATKAKDKPKATAAGKSKPSKPSSAKPSNATSDAKQLAKEAKSRKSVAYHKAFKEAKDQGKPEEECRLKAKQVSVHSK
ncbi:unnamed protein product, partial [Symbiodinium sp. KB8]